MVAGPQCRAESNLSLCVVQILKRKSIDSTGFTAWPRKKAWNWCMAFSQGTTLMSSDSEQRRIDGVGYIALSQQMILTDQDAQQRPKRRASCQKDRARYELTCRCLTYCGLHLPWQSDCQSTQPGRCLESADSASLALHPGSHSAEM